MGVQKGAPFQIYLHRHKNVREDHLFIFILKVLLLIEMIFVNNIM